VLIRSSVVFESWHERLFEDEDDDEDDEYKTEKANVCSPFCRGPLGRGGASYKRGLKVELIDVIFREDGRRAKQDLAAVDDFEFT